MKFYMVTVGHEGEQETSRYCYARKRDAEKELRRLEKVQEDWLKADDTTDTPYWGHPMLRVVEVEPNKKAIMRLVEFLI